MSKSASELINDAFMAAWDVFGDDKSTEFLVQFTADKLGIEPEDVYDALAAEHPHQDPTP